MCTCVCVPSNVTWLITRPTQVAAPACLPGSLSWLLNFLQYGSMLSLVLMTSRLHVCKCVWVCVCRICALAANSLSDYVSVVVVVVVPLLVVVVAYLLRLCDRVPYVRQVSFLSFMIFKRDKIRIYNTFYGEYRVKKCQNGTN